MPMTENTELILCCLAFSGFGLFALIYAIAKTKTPRFFSKQILVSVIMIAEGIIMALICNFGDFIMCVPAFLGIAGMTTFSLGVYNSVLVKKCSEPINATYLGRTNYRADSSYPIFEYTYEGEVYKSTAQQTVSNRIFSFQKTYRIYIDPKQPQRYIIYPNLLKNKENYVFAVLLTAAAVGTYYFLFR